MFMFIAIALAAEQRAVVAHSVSYGFDSRKILEAPAGATDGPNSIFHFLRSVRGLKYFYCRIPTVGTCRALLRSFNFLSEYGLNKIKSIWLIPSPTC